MFRLRDGVVLVAPDDQVEERVQERFGNVVVTTAVRWSVLVEDEEVEPLVGVLARSLHLHAVVQIGSVKTLIADGAQTIQSKLRLAFGEQQWVNVDIFYK